MRIRSLLLVALVVGGWFLIPARPAAACTCSPFDTRKALSESPAAFVGSLLTREQEPLTGPEEAPPSGNAVFRFQVERAVKEPAGRPLGGVVSVRSSESEASCGLSVSPGQRVGIILNERDGQWYGSLCRQTTPERLLRAAEPLPPPDAEAPPELFLGSTYGGGRATALKYDGRITGLGAGAGTITAASACPDRDHVVELFTTTTPEGATLPGVAVRRSDTMIVEFERSLPEWQNNGPGGPAEGIRTLTGVACRANEGRELILVGRIGVDASGRTQIVRITRPATPADPPEGIATLVWEGAPYRHAAFGPQGATAYLGLFPNGEDLVSVDLRGPGQAPSEPRPVVILPPGAGAVTVSPDGKRLATVAVPMSQPTQVSVTDLTTSPPALRVAPLSESGIAGEMLWVNDDKVVFAPRLRPAEPVRVFDGNLRLLHSWTGWVAERSVATPDAMLYGAGPDPGLGQTVVRQAPLETGTPRTIRHIEDALVFALVDVSGTGATRAGDTPPTSGTEVSTTTTTSPAQSPTTGIPQRPAPVTTTTTARPPGPEATSPPAGPTAAPKQAETTTTRPPRGAGDPSGEALSRPGDGPGDEDAGHGSWLSGWVLIAVLVFGVATALGIAALSSGGLTAIKKHS